MGDKIREEDYSELATVNDSVVVAETEEGLFDNSKSDEIRLRALQIRDQIDSFNFELGRLLRYIQRSGIWLKWKDVSNEPYDNFMDYVERELLVRERKAQYLISMYWWYAEEHKDPALIEAAKEMGWTKASLLVGVITPKNMEGWADLAKSLSTKKLREEVRIARKSSGVTRRQTTPKSGPESSGGTGSVSDAGGGEQASVMEGSSDSVVGDALAQPGEELPSESIATGSLVAPSSDDGEKPEDRKTVSEQIGIDPVVDKEERKKIRHEIRFVFDEEQKANVEAAIARAGEVAEMKFSKPGDMMDFIATAFLAMYGGTGTRSKTRQVTMRNDILAGVERACGVDIIAYERGTEHAIFGMNTIKRLLGEEVDYDEPEP